MDLDFILGVFSSCILSSTSQSVCVLVTPALTVLSLYHSCVTCPPFLSRLFLTVDHMFALSLLPRKESLRPAVTCQDKDEWPVEKRTCVFVCVVCFSFLFVFRGGCEFPWPELCVTYLCISLVSLPSRLSVAPVSVGKKWYLFLADHSKI